LSEKPGGNLTRIAIALAIAAALIPVSLLIGLPPLKSIMVSVLVAIAFLLFAAAMTKLVKR
jgi:hypothetical protein